MFAQSLPQFLFSRVPDVTCPIGSLFRAMHLLLVQLRPYKPDVSYYGSYILINILTFLD